MNGKGREREGIAEKRKRRNSIRGIKYKERREEETEEMREKGIKKGEKGEERRDSK